MKSVPTFVNKIFLQFAGTILQLAQEKSLPYITMETNFEKLSSLVLVDIMAALPMKQVMRLVLLDHETLRQTCSLKWVHARMADVSFGEIFRAHVYEGHVAATFCSNTVMKRLRGRATISVPDITLLCSRVMITNKTLEKFSHFTENFENSRKVLRASHIRLEGALDVKRTSQPFEKFEEALTPTKLTYVSKIIKSRRCFVDIMRRNPKIVFEYECYYDRNQHFVKYRPALLNGRHVVDVISAVCGLADFFEAELNWIKKEATKNASNMGNYGNGWEGVWHTCWRGASVTAWEERCRESFVKTYKKNK